MKRTLLVVLFASLVCACGDDTAVQCESSSECNVHPEGVCLTAPTGNTWCAYAGVFGDGCASGTRWAEEAGDGLANTCVEEATPDAGVDATPPPDGAPDAPMPDAPSPETFSLSVSNAGGGTVTSDPAGIDCGSDCGETYPAFTTVVITATPDSGMVFQGWGGACAVAGSMPNCTLMMTTDRSVTATFAPPGSVVELTTFGGTGLETGGDIAIDASGNRYVVGSFTGMITIGGTMLLGFGGTDVFAAKFDSSGALVWAKAFGGSSDDHGTDIAFDSAGNAWIAGDFQGSINFGGGALTSGGSFDVFLAKLASADGSHLFSDSFGATMNEFVGGLDVDAGNNVFLTGFFYGSNVSLGGTSFNSAGSTDVFLAKYNSMGVHQWSQRFGSTGSDEAHGLDVDSGGNVVITGLFQGTPDFGGGALTNAGGVEMFLAKYATTGSHLWSQGRGGAGADRGLAAVTDSANNVLVTGRFSGSANFGGTMLTSGGASDILVAKYDPMGVHQWSFRFGAGNDDFGQAIAVDSANNPVVTGFFQATVDFGGGPIGSAGTYDVFALKLAGATGSFQWAQGFGGSNADEGTGIAVIPSDNPVVTGHFFGAATFGDMGATSTGGQDIFIVELNP